ncbi:hypothetical protein GCM10025762_02400 [Haloechinothrix salitolerans]
MSGDCIAAGDESSRPNKQGLWLYAMAFPMVRADRAATVREDLHTLRPVGTDFLHFYDLPQKTRLSVARDAGQLDWEAALVVVQLTHPRGQERSRRRILANALPKLGHVEHVTTVLLESRARSDKHDRRTIDRLRGSLSIADALTVEHVDKTAEPLCWLADLIVGAFVANEAGGDPDPWHALDEARPLEVTWLPHDRP